MTENRACPVSTKQKTHHDITRQGDPNIHLVCTVTTTLLLSLSLLWSEKDQFIAIYVRKIDTRSMLTLMKPLKSIPRSADH